MEVGASLRAVMIAKEFAPSGRPDFEKIFHEGTQLSVWNKEQGKEVTAKFIFLFLVSLNKYFNLVRPMNSSQMEDLAIEFTEYTVFKFEDFIAFFEGIKRQRFGQVRDRLDPSLIWEFFRKYDSERDEACLRMARSKGSQESTIRSIPEPTREQRTEARTDGLSGALSQVKKHIQNGRK